MCQQDAQWRSMPHNVWTLMITSNHSLRNKSLRAYVELLQGGVRLVQQQAVTVNYGNRLRKTQKRFSVLRKKRAKLKAKKITTTFGKSLFLTQYRMRYPIYMPPNTKDLAVKPIDGCWKPAKRKHARASKQLRFAASTETFNGNQAQ